jgi:small subunit ribosomal protein S20
MAHHKSAKKRIRRNERRAVINGARRSRIRTFIRKVEDAIATGDKASAEAALKEAQPEMARGASKGVFHRNTMARKLSRLSKRVKALGA